MRNPGDSPDHSYPPVAGEALPQTDAPDDAGAPHRYHGRFRQLAESNWTARVLDWHMYVTERGVVGGPPSLANLLHVTCVRVRWEGVVPSGETD